MKNRDKSQKCYAEWKKSGIKCVLTIPFRWSSRKDMYNTVIEKRLPEPRVGEYWQGRSTSIRGDGNVLYLNCSGDYSVLYIY